MARHALHEFRGLHYRTRELAQLSGVPFDTLRARLWHGWTVEQAVATPTPAQRRRGVVSNFPTFAGTGAGSTAQETPEITFSDEDDF